MSKKFQILLSLLTVFSMLLGACASSAEPVVEEPQAPVIEEAGEAPALPASEIATLFDELVNSLSTTGYGMVKPAALSEEMADKMPFLLDVREVSEVEQDGYIEGAVNIPVRDVLNNLDKLPGLDDPIVVTCASGHRGALVFAALKLLGYTNVRNLNGGLNAWKNANLPLVKGFVPAAGSAISTPIIADQALFETLNGFLTSLPAGYYNVKPDVLAEKLTEATPPTLIDLRTVQEVSAEGYIEGSVNIPVEELFTSLDQLPGKDELIFVYCAGGQRSAIALEGLTLLGYTKVINLGGGYNSWRSAGMPVEGWVDWATLWNDYLVSMPAGYYTIKPADLNTALAETTPFLLDVRETTEIETDGYIAGAVNIPVREVLNNLDKLPGKDQPIVVYCASGHRGGMVLSALQFLGYTNVKSLAGGLGGWKKAELPVETGTPPTALTLSTAPEVDATRLAHLTTFFTNLPEGFYTVKAADLNIELTGATVPFILDVRTVDEYNAGFIEGAVNVNITDVPANLSQLPTDKAAPIVVLCQSGHRGAIVMMYLQMMGYTNVRNLGGGMNAWTGAELPVDTAG